LSEHKILKVKNPSLKLKVIVQDGDFSVIDFDSIDFYGIEILKIKVRGVA